MHQNAKEEIQAGSQSYKLPYNKIELLTCEYRFFVK
jgi:hypothetical protein